MEKFKEKILCALESNAGELREYGYFHYSIRNCPLCMYVENTWKRVLINPATFFRDAIYEEVDTDINEWTYKAEFQGQTTDLTKEEFDNILKIRQEKREQKRIEDLDKLCKK